MAGPAVPARPDLTMPGDAPDCQTSLCWWHWWHEVHLLSQHQVLQHSRHLLHMHSQLQLHPCLLCTNAPARYAQVPPTNNSRICTPCALMTIHALAQMALIALTASAAPAWPTNCSSHATSIAAPTQQAPVYQVLLATATSAPKAPSALLGRP